MPPDDEPELLELEATPELALDVTPDEDPELVATPDDEELLVVASS